MNYLREFAPRYATHLLSAILLSAVSTAAIGKTHHVAKWGIDEPGCGSKSDPCFTIGFTLLNNAQSNDRITVWPGTYAANLVINTGKNGSPLEGLKLESAAGRYGTVIESVLGGEPVIRIMQRRVQIGKKGKGFTLTGATIGQTAIEIDSTDLDRCKIEGNKVSGNGGGLLLRGAKHQVRHNLIKGNLGSGIRCYDCEDGMIQDNHLVGNGVFGISLWSDSDRLVIHRNVSSRNGSHGIEVTLGATFNRINNNVFESNFMNGVNVANVEGSLLQGNIAIDNAGSGYRVNQDDFFRPAKFKHNLSVGNTTEGVVITDLSNAKVERNTAIQNVAEGFYFDTIFEHPSIKNNNTAGNGNNCGLKNDTGESLTYKKHFFASGEGVCGLDPYDAQSTIANTPSATNINVAKGL